MNKSQLQLSRRITAANSLVPISVGGLTVMADLTKTKAERVVHHGDFKGIKVNSPATLQIGDSIAIWPNADKPLHVTMSKAAMGVLAKQYLEDQGFTITPVAADLG